MTEALSLVRILINTEAMIVIVLYHDEKQHLVHKTSQFWNMKNETNVLCANLYSVYKTRAKTEPNLDGNILARFGFYRAMLCIRGTSHGAVSVCPSVRHKSVFY